MVLLGTGAAHADSSVVGWGLNRFGAGEVPDATANAVQVAAGFDHGLALRSDGTVLAWGSNLDGEREVPANLGPVVAVYGGDWVSLALSIDGSVRVWGASPSNPIRSIPASATNIASLDIGYASHVVALRGDGTVVAWGANFANQLQVPENLTQVVQVSAGYGYSMALRADGEVVTWGDRIPQPMPAATNVVAVEAGWTDAYLLQADGQVLAWGPSGMNSASEPLDVADAVAISAAFQSVTVLRRNGTVILWPQPTEPALAPPSNLQGVTAVSSHGHASFAMVGNPSVNAPKIEVQTTPEGQTLGFLAERGRTYRIEYTDQLGAEHWRIASIRAGVGEPIRWRIGEASGFELYRVVVY